MPDSEKIETRGLLGKVAHLLGRGDREKDSQQREAREVISQAPGLEELMQAVAKYVEKREAHKEKLIQNNAKAEVPGEEWREVGSRLSVIATAILARRDPKTLDKGIIMEELGRLLKSGGLHREEACSLLNHFF